jgi:hypothetical protein
MISRKNKACSSFSIPTGEHHACLSCIKMLSAQIKKWMFIIAYDDLLGAYTRKRYVPRPNVIRFLHAAIPLYSSQKFWALNMPQVSSLSSTIALLWWRQEWNYVLPPPTPHRRNWHSSQSNHYALVGAANETNRPLLKNLLSSHETCQCNVYCRCNCGFQNKNNPKRVQL